MSTSSSASLLLAHESECQLLKFWFHDRVCDGLNYQGELFFQLRSFSLHRRHYAYELGSRLLDLGLSVIICCSQERYLLGVNLRNDWNELASIEKQQSLVEVQGMELALFAARVLQARSRTSTHDHRFPQTKNPVSLAA